MTVELVTADALAAIAGWREKRGFPPWPEGWLSARGYWVPGLAAGWLVPTESARALLEDFVTNPSAPKDETDEALFAVERHIEGEARRLGFRYLQGTTKLEVIRDRVRRAGYTVSEPVFSLHHKELKR